ncbi:MAG: aerial mycelium formation protein [Actinomycetota bacterium]
MSDQPLHRPEGRRRIDRVLAPSFARDLTDIDISDLRRRRDEALAEREYLSLLRRLVHGRLDILRAESSRRTEGGAPASIQDQLSAILSADEERGTSRGEALRIPVPDEEVANARRRIERLVSDTSISDAPSLSDQEMTRALARLEEEERMVSKARAAVLAVHDRLQDELKRRFKEDLSQITTS